MGGPEKWQKWGRAKRLLSHFYLVEKSGHGHFWKSTFKFDFVSGDFL